jgi:hypothetical protein
VTLVQVKVDHVMPVQVKVDHVMQVKVENPHKNTSSH